MPKLMYSEFYKLRKSKSFYICGIVTIVFVLLVYGTFFLMDKAQQEHVENGSYGVTVTVENVEENAPVWDSIEILDVEQQMFGGFAGIIIAVFSAIFVIGEYGNGAMKNITGKGYARWKIFLTKYIATGIAVILLLLFMVFAVVLFGIIFKGSGGLTGEFFIFAGGGFPIRLKAGEIVAILTVSNLPHMDDHKFIVRVLSEYLEKKI